MDTYGISSKSESYQFEDIYYFIDELFKVIYDDYKIQN